MPDYGLGRREFVYDPGDEKHLMRALVAEEAPRPVPYAYYHGSMFLNQGGTSQCVEYSWHHYVQTGKIRPRVRHPYWPLGEPYRQMQDVDEWEGNDYDGTSVRAGAKIMQQMGYIGEYRWAWDLETVVDAVTRVGPVVMGTNWYRSMFVPDSQGVVQAAGPIDGGHAWLIDGASRKRGLARAKNSWGTEWGKRGRFWIPFEVLERLIREDGEACLALEVQT